MTIVSWYLISWIIAVKCVWCSLNCSRDSWRHHKPWYCDSYSSCGPFLSIVFSLIWSVNIQLFYIRLFCVFLFNEILLMFFYIIADMLIRYQTHPKLQNQVKRMMILTPQLRMIHIPVTSTYAYFPYFFLWLKCWWIFFICYQKCYSSSEKHMFWIFIQIGRKSWKEEGGYLCNLTLYWCY